MFSLKPVPANQISISCYIIKLIKWNVRIEIGDICAVQDVADDPLQDAIDERLHLIHRLRVLGRVVVLRLKHILELERYLQAAGDDEHDVRGEGRAAGRRVPDEPLVALARLAAVFYVPAFGVRPARARHVRQGLLHVRSRQHTLILVLEVGLIAHSGEVRIARACVRVRR